MNKIIFISLSLLTISCHTKIKNKNVIKGSIELKSRVIYNASKGYSNNVVLHISKMHFYNDKIMEFVPNPLDKNITDSINIIKDTLYHNLKVQTQQDVNAYDYSNIIFNKSVYDKRVGAMFQVNRDTMYGYSRRIDLEDTILDKTEYKRFMIKDKFQISHFWLEKTDSMLPYSLNKIADRDYGARLKRIDTYRSGKDVFQTVVLEYDDRIPKGIEERLKKIK